MNKKILVLAVLLIVFLVAVPIVSIPSAIASPEYFDVTFTHTGIDASATGTVVTVDGANYTYADLPKIFNWENGTEHTYAYADSVSSSIESKLFNLTSVTGSTSPIIVWQNETVTGNYEVLTLIRVDVIVEIGDTAKGDLYEVDSTPYATVETFWFINNTNHTFKFYSPIPGDAGEKYLWNSTSGLASTRSGTITVTESGEVHATYVWTESAVTPEDYVSALFYGDLRWIFLLVLLLLALALAKSLVGSTVTFVVLCFIGVLYLANPMWQNMVCGLLLILAAFIVMINMMYKAMK